MGLDIYFNKAKKSRYRKLKQNNEEFKSKEVAYFRKVNFLMAFFNYEGNCEWQEIDKCEIEDLVNKCKAVLDNHSLAEELLPVQQGFFFGSYEYNEYYFNDVQDVHFKFTQILNNLKDDEVVLMYCWW